MKPIAKMAKTIWQPPIVRSQKILRSPPPPQMDRAAGAWRRPFAVDYSPGRKTPLERDIRVSNSGQQTDELWGALVKDNIVKGWARQEPTAVQSTG